MSQTQLLGRPLFGAAIDIYIPEASYKEHARCLPVRTAFHLQLCAMQQNVLEIYKSLKHFPALVRIS